MTSDSCLVIHRSRIRSNGMDRNQDGRSNSLLDEPTLSAAAAAAEPSRSAQQQQQQHHTLITNLHAPPFDPQNVSSSPRSGDDSYDSSEDSTTSSSSEESTGNPCHNTAEARFGGSPSVVPPTTTVAASSRTGAAPSVVPPTTTAAASSRTGAATLSDDAAARDSIIASDSARVGDGAHAPVATSAVQAPVSVSAAASAVQTPLSFPAQPVATGAPTVGICDEDEDSQSPARPLHEELSYQSAVQRDSMTQLRNKQILLSRLQESFPRGRLAQINFTRRRLDVEDAPLLCTAILANPYLSVLKLSYNALGDHGATMISRAILGEGEHHPNLSVLDLGFNSIGDAGCEALAVHSVAGNSTLQTLSLSGNQIGEKGVLAVAGAILHGTGLIRLHLSANSIGPLGTKAIAGAIVKHDARLSVSGGLFLNAGVVRSSIQELHLSNTSSTSETKTSSSHSSGTIESDLKGFIAIPGMLLANRSLRSLILSNNDIDDNDMMLLGQALTQNKQLPMESLHLSFNQITCRGVECLMNAIWGSKTLRELRLDNNRFQDRGAQLCAVVLTSVQLEVLDLSFNRVTTVGIKALMRNISESQSLQFLGLSGIPIDQNASKAISFALAYNSSLQTLRVDNCSTGYSSQRHIVAGIVSNRRASLRVLSGFDIGPIAMTLGIPRLPEEWSNGQVLGFFRLMWQQWLLKSGRGNSDVGEHSIRGPAPPAAVATAAKIAFASLGNSAGEFFRVEPHQKPLSERAPVDSARTALMERTSSGTMCLPDFSTTDPEVSDLTENDGKVAAQTPVASIVSPFQGPLRDPERRSRNLQWLRRHFRSLSDVGRLPFSNADLWQLHQYYFSPSTSVVEEERSADSSSLLSAASIGPGSAVVQAVPPAAPPAQAPSLGRAISFNAIGDAVAVSDVAARSGSSKRPSDDSQKNGPATKRAKNLKPRIAYYPRIMTKIQSLGTKPMDQTLSLLRQLKYAESIFFRGRTPYTEFNQARTDQSSYEDIEMILLDLL